MNTQKQIVLMVALMFLLVGGCAAYTAIELPVRAPDQAQWTEDQSLERGALLFANNCRTCHGNRGEGGVGPQLLNAEASQFQDQDPLKLAANRTLLRRTLSCGRAGTLMPAWLNSNGGALNAIQIEHIVNFLTSPIEVTDEGDATSKWWDEAEEFAHNLNGEVAVLVGGDTLVGLASSHGIGAKELAEFNGIADVSARLKKGTELKIPSINESKGYTYTVYKDNETIAKVAESQYVGARILAELNNIDYSFSEKRGVATMHLKTAEGADVAGLFPGTTLAFPEGATYTVNAGDTLASIAETHGLTTSAIVSLNRGILGSLADDDEIPFERRLALPKQVAVVQAGQTLSVIAKLHDIEIADLAAENALAEDAVVAAGTELKLPADAQYVVQAGDTWALVATEHGTTAADLAGKNSLTQNDRLSPEVVLTMPKIDAYVVQGDSLADLAQGYGNVSADSIAAKNGIEANSILAVGTSLHLPDDAFGTAPGDAKNPGTACVQYAVSNNVFQFIQTGESPGAEPNPPSDFSQNVTILATQTVPEFDWTIDADGTKSEPNKGAVKVAPGTAVTFENVAGLHTITVNGTADKPDIGPAVGDKRTLTFADPGTYKLTCDYHPAMLAWLFVEAVTP